MRAKGKLKPLLMVDIDGVISLFGPFPAAGGGPEGVEGRFHSIEGIPHFLSSTAAGHLLDLGELFEIVWASGWEERAEDHLPHLLGLPAGLPFLRFPVAARASRAANAHWKLEAIGAFAGARALAWLDDSLDDSCRRWAAERPHPTLLVHTTPSRGLTLKEASELSSWAQRL
jgi:hypothetical protein